MERLSIQAFTIRLASHCHFILRTHSTTSLLLYSLCRLAKISCFSLLANPINIYFVSNSNADSVQIIINDKVLRLNSWTCYASWTKFNKSASNIYYRCFGFLCQTEFFFFVGVRTWAKVDMVLVYIQKNNRTTPNLSVLMRFRFVAFAPFVAEIYRQRNRNRIKLPYQFIY